MLTVITGRSRRLWPRALLEIGRVHAEGAQRLLLITPDQYTLQAELDLVDKLHLPGLLEIEVLSPSRLITRVFTLAGSPKRVRIDTRGKAMMLADVLRTAQDSLVYYGGAADRRGFAERLASTIGDFKRAGMTPDDVLEQAARLSGDEALHGKLQDIALLYARYEEKLAGAFLDGEDAQEALLARLPASGILKDTRIWVYGFDLITPQFMRQLAVMAREAASVRLFLTCESTRARDGLVFAPVRDAIAMLGRHFDAERLLWEEEHITGALPTAPEIEHLERELFAVPPHAYAQPPEAIALRVAANPYDEAMQVAADILRLARAGIPYDAIAVVAGDTEAYAGAIETAFGRSGIPFHLTRKRPAIAHPLIRTWLAALRTVTTQWRRQEDALDWLKGGFSGLTVEEAERLENYALENGLRGPKWRRTIPDADLEALRLRFVTPLLDLQKKLREARTNTESLAAAYQLLEAVDAYGTLTAWQETLTARGLLTEAAECTQAWRLLLEALDQLHELLHGSRMRMDGMAQVLEAGFLSAELNVVPPSPGMVQIGALGHAKIGGECHTLFLLGMQDGILRANAPKLIMDREAARMAEAGSKEGAFGLRGDALAQLIQINLLDTIAAPSDGLYISHSISGPDGEPQRPAAWLSLLRRVFPQLQEAGSALKGIPQWHAPGAALDALGPALRAARGDLSREMAETAAWLYHAPETRLMTERVLEALSTPLPVERLSRQATDRIYAHTRTSVSRLEAFGYCPFRHFVEYGLRPIPRRPYAVERSETGTFYHRAMEGYTKAAMRDARWPSLSREESDALMDEALAPLRSEWADSPLDDNAMQRAAGDAFCRIARRAAWNYTAQMRRGTFHTERIEARFGPGEALPAIELSLPDGRTCWLEGRIDRIDLHEEDGQRWLRVVDYKSGGASIDFTRVYGGLQLQLLIYLAAALAASPHALAAGAFYARFDDPYVETDSQDIAEIERLIAEQLRLKGITLSDVRVIRAMGAEEDLLKKDGGLKKKNDLLTEAELQALMAHAQHVAQRMASAMSAGEIAARPAETDGWRACQWCDYQGVCGFDPALDGYGVRPLERMTKRTLMERLGVADAETE